MNTQDVLTKMQELIGEQFAVDADEITMETSFEEDLGADSVDLVELVMAMEEEFDIGEVEEEEVGLEIMAHYQLHTLHLQHPTLILQHRQI